MDVKVKVYDVTGKSFNQEEIEQMNLKIKENEKMNIYSYINILNHTIIDKIPLFGMKEGVISLSLTNNHGIDSNTVQINIFDKLEIFPPTLLLYPGCEFTIKILGGPENEKSLNRIYNIENEEVASIGNFFPLVKAKKIGNTFVSIKLSYKPDENQLYSTQDEKEFYNSIKDQILTEVKIPVQVAFPERVEIEGANNRKIYVNSSVRFLASLKLGDLSFSYCIGDTDFTWSVDNPHIAKFNVKTQENTKCESSKIENSCSDNSLLESPEKIANNYSIDLANISNQIGAYLVSYNYGIVSVKLDMNINYPSPYEAHRPNFFISKKNVSVEDNVWVDVAEFYDKAPGKSLIYLLPFNVSHSLNLHKKDQVIF